MNSSNLSLVTYFSILFFVWAVLTITNYFLIYHIQDYFDLTYSESTLVNIYFRLAYLLIAIPAGRLIVKKGFKNSLIIGSILSFISIAFLEISIFEKSYIFFLANIFFLGAGITIFQVSANLYILLMGNRNNAASRLTFMQGFNSIGAFIAPIIVAESFNIMLGDERINLNTTTRMMEEVNILYVPYLVLTVLVLIISILLLKIRIPEIDYKNIEPMNVLSSLRRTHSFHFPQLRLGAFALFAYVGAEVSLTNYLIDFSKPNVKYYLGAALTGRFIGFFVLKKISPRVMVTFNSALAVFILFISLIIFNPEATVYLIVFIGFLNSILFPCIYALSLNGLGKYSVQGSSTLIMFVAGGAIVPFMVRNFSYVNDIIAFGIIILCYSYIALYGFKFSRFVKKVKS